MLVRPRTLRFSLAFSKFPVFCPLWESKSFQHCIPYLRQMRSVSPTLAQTIKTPGFILASFCIGIKTWMFVITWLIALPDCSKPRLMGFLACCCHSLTVTAWGLIVGFEISQGVARFCRTYHTYIPQWDTLINSLCSRCHKEPLLFPPKSIHLSITKYMCHSHNPPLVQGEAQLAQQTFTTAAVFCWKQSGISSGEALPH